jgi:hypothetical protein
VKRIKNKIRGDRKRQKFRRRAQSPKLFEAPPESIQRSMLFLAAAIHVALAADEPPPPSATSFVTEIPTPGPDGYTDGFGGSVLIAFIVGLVGLGVSIVGTIFVIAPLIETHEHKDNLLEGLEQFDIEGFGED